MTDDAPRESGDAGEKRLLRLATVVYALQAVGLVFPVGLVVAVIIDYVKLPDTVGTWFESHFRWQIRTFWTAAVLVVLGVATYIFVIGYLVLLGTWIWVIYRVVKGWLYLDDRRPLVRGR
ncbi:MAG: hypothetical protein M0Z84_09315 [Gammaproteobacteria bacterium]|nr:hypothetical protein [Gammaproteobacteria bacterium]